MVGRRGKKTQVQKDFFVKAIVPTQHRAVLHFPFEGACFSQSDPRCSKRLHAESDAVDRSAARGSESEVPGSWQPEDLLWALGATSGFPTHNHIFIPSLAILLSCP